MIKVNKLGEPGVTVKYALFPKCQCLFLINVTELKCYYSLSYCDYLKSNFDWQ